MVARVTTPAACALLAIAKVARPATERPVMKCDHTCSECGTHEQGSWFDDVAKKLAERKLCFGCDHWVSLEKIGERSDVVRVGGVHYMIGAGTHDGAGFKGFGGAQFKIKFVDGREAETRNLWCQGTIPHRFRERMPNNAEFLVQGA